MNIYKDIVFPRLARLDAEEAHERALGALEIAQSFAAGRWMLRRIAGGVPWLPVTVAGIRFPNPIGIAAGLDKDARVAAGLVELGWGHVEVGTLTPRPQAGNARPRLFRLPGSSALVNRMGFPNCGVEGALPRLRKLAAAPRRHVLGISIGKQKETPLEDAAGDYVEVLRRTYPCADYFAVNVSSPNTPGLRALQGGGHLRVLTGELVRESDRLARRGCLARRPVFVKIAPDLPDAELKETVEAALESGVDGIIATNTTVSREGVSNPAAAEDGGLSGRPLAAASSRMVAMIRRLAGSKVALIGVGGVFSAEDVRERLDAGANLVQVYTGLVYEGPAMAGRILRGMRDEYRVSTPSTPSAPSTPSTQSTPRPTKRDNNQGRIPC